MDEYELTQDEGQLVTPEQLCAQYPELLEAVVVSLETLAATTERLQIIGACEPPQQIGEFEVLEQIGVGGSGVVFRCQQTDPNRLVAVKVFKPTLNVDEQTKKYRRELRVFESISASGLADVFVSGITVWGGVRCFWIAMQLLDGGRIDRYAANHQFSQQTILQTFRSICVTLLAAHRQGIVHRDLKPSNILMSNEGEPHIVDFGIASIAINSDDELTETMETIAGTAAWMAPEVITGDVCAPDIRSDIYSLGVVLFQLLSGKHPLGADKLPLSKVTDLVRQKRPARLSQMMEDVSNDLDTFASRLIDPAPDYRYQNLDDVIADTDRLLNNEPVRIRSVSVSEKTWRWCRQNTALAVLSCLAMITASAALIVYVSSAIRVQRYADRLFETNKDLEYTLQQQQRSTVSARLGNIAEHLHYNPREAELKLNDTTKFPPSMRSFGWRLLKFQSQSGFQCLSCADTAIRSICFSHTDAIVATHSNNGRLQLTDVISGKRLWEADGHQKALYSKLKFSPDDQFLYSIPAQFGIRKYDVLSGQLAETLLPKMTMRPGVLEISEDGRWIVALSLNNKLVLIDSTSGKTYERRLDPDLKFKSLWVQNDGRIVGGLTSTGIIHKWSAPLLSDHQTTNLTERHPGFDDITHAVSSLEMGDGAAQAVICRHSDVLAIRLDTKPGPVVRQFNAHGERPKALCFVPPFSLLITEESSSRISNLYTDSNTIFHEEGKKSRSNAVTSDKKRIAIGDMDGGIRIYTLEMPSIRRKVFSASQNWPLNDYGAPISMVATPDARQLFIGYSEGFVVEIDTVTHRPLTVTNVGNGSVSSLSLDPAGEWLTCAVNRSEGRSCACVYGVAQKDRDKHANELQRIASFKLPQIQAIMNSGDGRLVYIADRSGEISVFDTSSWSLVRRWHAHDGGAYALVVGDTHIWSGGGDGKVKIWGRSDGRLLQEWGAHEKRVRRLKISPDGQRLYTASPDRTTAIWTWNGQLIRRQTGHAAPVRAVAISPDGQTLATGGEDYLIHLWDAQTGDPQFVLQGHTNSIHSLRFTPLGLVSASHDLTVSIWGDTVNDSSTP